MLTSREWQKYAAQNKAVVIRGLEASHFADEVLSWHSFNGQDAKKLLPAILITTRHPQHFHELHVAWQHSPRELWSNEVALLIPLQRCCRSATDVAALIDQIFADIAAKRPMHEFSVVLEMRAGHHGALIDALIIEPSHGCHGAKLGELAQSLVRSHKVLRKPERYEE